MYTAIFMYACECTFTVMFQTLHMNVHVAIYLCMYLCSFTFCNTVFRCLFSFKVLPI